MGFAFSLPFFFFLVCFVWEVDLLSSQVSVSSLEHKTWSLGEIASFHSLILWVLVMVNLMKKTTKERERGVRRSILQKNS
jgi:hypothetical protein